ncbi:MAG: hypothetical protein FJX54_09400 [Alphaproteobacteria bacterium]|nr:hypothetical protein [Alphaproteobacteria bacterium]
MRLIAALLVLLALPASAAERFTGDDASISAGAYIDKAIGYPNDYTPGRLAVDYIGVYEGAFVTQVRFTPSRGHQVVLGKGFNERKTDGAACADFRIIVERFSAASLEKLERDRSGVKMEVSSVDTVRGVICRLTPRDISVEIAEVKLALPADRAAFANPFAIHRGDVGGGI